MSQTKKAGGSVKGKQSTKGRTKKPPAVETPCYTVPFPQGQTLLQQIAQMRGYVQEVLDNEPDRELRLKAVDRRHKQIEIEAKLQGEFKQDAPNPATVESLVNQAAAELVKDAQAEGVEMTLEEAAAMVKPHIESQMTH